jgi:uncharacterized protein (TIRG00374 family)
VKPSRIAQLVIGCLIAAAGLYVFLRNVDMTALGRELRSASAVGLLGTAGLSILTLYLRSIRWRFLLPDSEGAHRRGLFGLVMIAFMANNIFPARLGEAVRALLLWRKNHYRVAVSVGSLIVERVIDSLMFLMFFAIPVYLLPSLESLRLYAHGVSAIVAGVIAAFVLYATLTTQLTRLGGWIVSRLPERMGRVAGTIGGQLASTLDWLHSPKRVATIVVLSLLTTGCYPVMMILLVGDRAPFGFVEGMFSQAFAAIGSAIPLAPAYVGTLHATLQYGLKQIGIATETATALAILYHAVNVVPITIVGLFYFFRTDLSFREMTSAKAQLEK